ncbi:MAG TPA: hypothetical protein VEL76_37120 [Gemmataceae bacterium]|nr:hypothetical protein [Gemmataceae bacterium]
MPRIGWVGLLTLCWLSWPAPAAAHHFTIDLKVQAGKNSATVHAETAAIGVKPKERSVLRVKAGSRVAVQWTLTNTDAKAAFKNVLVHFFAVKQEKLNQVAPAKLLKGVVAESALTIDFAPKDGTKGELTFTIDIPGFYHLRLETIGAAVGVDGHEHYAALDLIVE